MISLDGRVVAIRCTSTGGTTEVVDNRQELSSAVTGAYGYFSGGGWIDATHLTYRPSGTDSLFRVDTTSSSGPITLVMAASSLA